MEKQTNGKGASAKISLCVLFVNYEIHRGSTLMNLTTPGIWDKSLSEVDLWSLHFVDQVWDYCFAAPF